MVSKKASIAARVREIRKELYGENGIESLATSLNVPAATWLNYERGVTMPAETLLEFLELTDANPHWLLSGDGHRLANANALGIDRHLWRLWLSRQMS